MKCCAQCEGIENEFDASCASSELEAYRKNGPSAQTRLLLDTIRAHDVEGMTLLDIGGGVGAIQHELLDAGAAFAVSVDAASAYLETAKQEARHRNQSDRVTYHHGDFVELAPTLEPADIVTLDRVICCYHDMPALVAQSSALAKQIYALVFPVDRWWIRLGIRFANTYLRLRRNPFRIFAHRTASVDAIIRQNGLEPQLHHKDIFWQVMVYTRPNFATSNEPNRYEARHD